MSDSWSLFQNRRCCRIVFCVRNGVRIVLGAVGFFRGLLLELRFGLRRQLDLRLRIADRLGGGDAGPRRRRRLRRTVGRGVRHVRDIRDGEHGVGGDRGLLGGEDGGMVGGRRLCAAMLLMLRAAPDRGLRAEERGEKLLEGLRQECSPHGGIWDFLNPKKTVETLCLQLEEIIEGDPLQLQKDIPRMILVYRVQL